MSDAMLTEAEAPPSRCHYYYLDGGLIGLSFDQSATTVVAWQRELAARRRVPADRSEVWNTDKEADRG